jgi:hypothetical protein
LQHVRDPSARIPREKPQVHFSLITLWGVRDLRRLKLGYRAFHRSSVCADNFVVTPTHNSDEPCPTVLVRIGGSKQAPGRLCRRVCTVKDWETNEPTQASRAANRAVREINSPLGANFYNLYCHDWFAKHVSRGPLLAVPP